MFLFSFGPGPHLILSNFVFLTSIYLEKRFLQNKKSVYKWMSRDSGEKAVLFGHRFDIR